MAVSNTMKVLLIIVLVYSCLCDCQVGFYNNTNGVCTKCDPSCASCKDGSNGSCLSCPIQNYFQNNGSDNFGQCVPSCPAGNFMVGNFRRCCHPSCATCNGPFSTNCLTCSKPNYFMAPNKTCVTNCPNHYFKNTNGQVCTQCHESCGEFCSGPSANECLDCSGNLIYFVTNHSCVADCPDGFFKYLSGGRAVCSPCNSACKTCNGPKETDCLSCPNNTYYLELNHTCWTTCPTPYRSLANGTCARCADGTFYNNTAKACQNCTSPCKTCRDTGVFCLSCVPDNYLFESNHTCGVSCPGGYFKNATNQLCTKCDASCATCNGSLATNCLSCPNGTNYLEANHSCVSNCRDGFFKDLSDRRTDCSPCNSACKTCNGPRETDCLSCPNGKYYLEANHTCWTTCPESYYPMSDSTCSKCADGTFYNNTAKACQNCTPPCKTCRDKGAFCLSCVSKNYLFESNHTCGVNCPRNYFKNITSQICAKCDASCATCNGPSATNCLTCPNGVYYLEANHSCSTNCADGYYLDKDANDNAVCNRCDSSCATCKDGSNSGCLSCPNQRYFVPLPNVNYGKCLTSCPAGNYMDGTTRRCCDPACATCNGPLSTNCLTCSSPNYFMAPNNTCVTNCPNHYFKNTFGQVCTQCHQTCGNCSGPSANQCLDCSSNRSYIESNHSCVSNCRDGFFKDLAGGRTVCLPCNAACKTCSGPKETDCLTCPNGKYYLESNHTCWTTCPETYQQMANGTCGKCADGTFYNNTAKACQNCTSPCKTCRDTGVFCLSCVPDNYLFESNHTCGVSCPDGYFKNATNQLCTKCDASCATCNGSLATNCLTCPNGTYYLESNHSCVATCPESYYPLSNGTCGKCADGTFYNNTAKACQNCTSPCKTCGDTGLLCVSCVSNNYLFESNHTCGVNCPKNYFKNTTSQKCTTCPNPNVPDTTSKICCHRTCATCSGSASNECKTCPSGRYYWKANNTCLTTCPNSHHKGPNNHVCCHRSCDDCTGNSNTSCSSCPANTYLLNSNHSCGTDCPSNYYKDVNGRRCVKCDASCATCNGSSPTNCLTCPNGKYYLESNHTCWTTCPESYYPMSDRTCSKCAEGTFYNSIAKACQNCTSPCKTCRFTGVFCLSCVSKNYLFESNHTCGVSCPAGYFKNATSQICTKCDASCATCNGPLPTNCLTCPNGKHYLSKNHTCWTTCPSPYRLLANGACGICADGTFYNSTTRTCQSCHSTCKTCDGPKVTDCKSCQTSKALYQGRCYDNCPDGLYESGNTCHVCQAPCDKCKGSATNCTSCKKWYNLVRNTCVLDCPSGYYPARPPTSCNQCQTGCATCNNSATNCQSCSFGYYLSGNSCVTKCPSGQRGDSSRRQCLQLLRTLDAPDDQEP